VVSTSSCRHGHECEFRWRGHDRQSPQKDQKKSRGEKLGHSLLNIIFQFIIKYLLLPLVVRGSTVFISPNFLSIKAPSIWRTSRQLTTFSVRRRAKNIMALTEFPDAFRAATRRQKKNLSKPEKSTINFS